MRHFQRSWYVTMSTSSKWIKLFYGDKRSCTEQCETWPEWKSCCECISLVHDKVVSNPICDSTWQQQITIGCQFIKTPLVKLFIILKTLWCVFVLVSSGMLWELEQLCEVGILLLLFKCSGTELALPHLHSKASYVISHLPNTFFFMF